MNKVILWTLGIIVAAIALFEVTMGPSAEDRNGLLMILVTVAVMTGFAAWWIPRRAAKFTSLQRTVVVVALAAAGVIGVATAGAAMIMFFSQHDLNLLLVVLGFGIALGLVLAVTIAGPLNEDLRSIAQVAEKVAAGDLAARTGVTRPDEVGAAADALDEMVARLQANEEERLRDETARQSFLAAISHDLRTPLAALQAALEAVEDGVAPEPERYLRSMRHDVRALGALIDDLFLLTKIESGHLEYESCDLDLAELVDESVEALEPMAQRVGVSLELETDGKVPAFGGPEVLGRVIRNLIDNAIRHAPPNSAVRISVANNGSAMLRVEDDGPGFTPEFLDAAFESFERADRARTRSTGGAGLGLAIAKGVVVAHGGHIWAEAGPGGKVAFTLPASR